jgi:transposase-like protein
MSDPTRLCSNPHKREIVRKIKRGELTIPQAARRYDVPQSGVIGWLRMAGVKIPPEFDRPRRERSETPLSAASMGRRSKTDR